MEAIKKEHVYGASWKSGNRCFKFLWYSTNGSFIIAFRSHMHSKHVWLMTANGVQYMAILHFILKDQPRISESPDGLTVASFVSCAHQQKGNTHIKLALKCGRRLGDGCWAALDWGWHPQPHYWWEHLKD
jgi:hypothetical protein